MSNATTDPKPTTYYTIREIIRANERIGHHFFEPASKRFFNSVIGREVIGGRYFITSEQFEYEGRRNPRRYTVRECLDGEVNTVGDFQAFATAAQAKRAALELAKSGRSRVRVRIDGDDETFPAWIDPAERWNGWLCPSFDRDTAHRVAAAYECQWDASKGAYVDGDGATYYAEAAPTGEDVFPIGARGWCWVLAK